VRITVGKHLQIAPLLRWLTYSRQSVVLLSSLMVSPAIEGEPYAHKQKKACDYWQVTFPTVVLDHVEVTGIQQEGTHAKAETTLVWKPTQLGLVLKKQLAEQNRSEYESQQILGDASFVRMPLGDTEFKTFETFPFDKYDDGWRLK
jgi:hypothetical protein